MGVGMKLKVKAAIQQPIAWKKRIYFTYEDTQYVVNLVHDLDNGYELHWIQEGNNDFPSEPKWLDSFVENELNGESFESWLDDATEDLNG